MADFEQSFKGRLKMTKLQAIAKVFFFIIGVNAFVDAVGALRRCYFGSADGNEWFLHSLFGLFFYGLIAYFLIFQSDKLAVKLGKNSEEATEQWVVRLFIGAGIFAGGLLLAGSIREYYLLGDLFKTIAVLPTEICRWISSNEMPTLAWLIKMAAALYLLFGMKRFIRWQISKLKSLNLAIKAD